MLLTRRLRLPLAGLFASVAVAAVLAGRSHAAESRIPIPKTIGTDLQQAYARLHDDGFRVSIPNGFALYALLDPVAFVDYQSPLAGHRAAAGTVVTMRVCSCGLASSPAVPVGPLPRYTVPGFVGQPLRVANAWLRHKTLYLTEHAGALIAGDAETLNGNYEIVRQHPSRGSSILLGTGTYNASAHAGTFTPTPLTIWVRQTPKSNSISDIARPGR